MNTKVTTLEVGGRTATITQTHKGEPTTYHPRSGGSQFVTTGQTFTVALDGEIIGTVERAMVTRESRTPGKRYVNARWYSPGWLYRIGPVGESRRGIESSTKREGIERLVSLHTRSW